MQCFLDSDGVGMIHAMENEESDKDSHRCPSPNEEFANPWVTKLLKEYVGLESLPSQRGNVEIIGPRNTERDDEHQLAKERPLRNEEELGQELEDKEE